MPLAAHSRTTLQNTNRSTVKVYYRFHPYTGQELEVIHNPVRVCEWILFELGSPPRPRSGHSPTPGCPSPSVSPVAPFPGPSGDGPMICDFSTRRTCWR